MLLCFHYCSCHSWISFPPIADTYKAFPPQLILMTIQSFHQTEMRFIQGYQGKFKIMNTPVYRQILHTTLLDWFKILLSSVTSNGNPETQIPAYTDVFCLASQHKYNHSLLLEQMRLQLELYLYYEYYGF